MPVTLQKFLRISLSYLFTIKTPYLNSTIYHTLKAF